MQKILISASIVLAAVGLTILIRNRRVKGNPLQAAKHADKTGEKHLRKINHKVKGALS